MVKRRRELPSGNEQGSSSQQEWVRGPSTLPKVFKQLSGSKLDLIWNSDDQPVGPLTHPSLYSESIGVLIASSRRFDWTIYWEYQLEANKDWLWRALNEQMKEVAGIDEDGTQQPLTDEIYRQVMPPERHGRVRMMSRGVTPTTYFGTRGSSSHGSSSTRIEELLNEMAVMRNQTQEREEERQRVFDDMKRQAQEKEDENVRLMK